MLRKIVRLLAYLAGQVLALLVTMVKHPLMTQFFLTLAQGLRERLCWYMAVDLKWADTAKVGAHDPARLFKTTLVQGATWLATTQLLPFSNKLAGLVLGGSEVAFGLIPNPMALVPGLQGFLGSIHRYLEKLVSFVTVLISTASSSAMQTTIKMIAMTVSLKQLILIFTAPCVSDHRVLGLSAEATEFPPAV